MVSKDCFLWYTCMCCSNISDR